MEISDLCKKTIERINQYFEGIKESQANIKKENELLNQRVKIAEDTLLQFKENVQRELKKAYQAGYEAAMSELPSVNPEGGTKLVYTKN